MEAILQTLIAKYLTGEATPEEKVIVDNWRKESDDHETLFRELQDAWLIASNSSPIVIPDKEEVWAKICAKIKATPVVKLYSRKIMYRVATIAAVVALTIGISGAFLFNTQWQTIHSSVSDITVKTPFGQKSEIVLPDGTTVWLNSGTTLTYSTDYNKKKREVNLTGEAFFDVTSNPDRDFIVTAGEIEVKALGTSFDVSAYPDDLTAEVTLAEGRVTVSSTSGELLADMSPNQQVKIDKSRMTGEIVFCDAEIESLWRHGKLKIEDAPMDEVILKMERWYGINIKTKGKPSGEHHWMTIKTESLREMLELVNKITPINYLIEGEEVMITYK